MIFNTVGEKGNYQTKITHVQPRKWHKLEIFQIFNENEVILFLDAWKIFLYLWVIFQLVYSVKFNGELKEEVSNSIQQSFENVKVFMGAQDKQQAKVKIRNLNYRDLGGSELKYE